jgi:hypothetical protein
MNRFLLAAINDSGINDEVIAAVKVISANRAAATPAILRAFTGYIDPITPPTATERNTAILAMLSHYPLTLSVGSTGANP